MSTKSLSYLLIDSGSRSIRSVKKGRLASYTQQLHSISVNHSPNPNPNHTPT